MTLALFVDEGASVFSTVGYCCIHLKEDVCFVFYDLCL